MDLVTLCITEEDSLNERNSQDARAFEAISSVRYVCSDQLAGSCFLLNVDRLNTGEGSVSSKQHGCDLIDYVWPGHSLDSLTHLRFS